MLREQGRVRALLSNTRKWKKTQICTQGFRSMNHYNNGRTWPGFCLCSSGDAVTHRPLCFCFIWPSTLDWNWEISALKFRSGLDQLSKPPMRFVLIYNSFSIWLLPFYEHECISSPKMNLSMIFFLLFNTKEDISKNYGNPLTFVSHIVEVNGFKVKISSFVFFWNNRKLCNAVKMVCMYVL